MEGLPTNWPRFPSVYEEVSFSVKKLVALFQAQTI